MKRLSSILLLIISTLTYAQQPKQTAEVYILKYKDFAISEMYRAGVPASITLAQGILESQNGNSRLASLANNHFGIKCKTGWTGKTITADDDAVGECFRAYESALESYKDHSNFLRENWRYSECFKLERTDYVGWAEGLRRAGYATNPKYNTLITGIIERYNLHQYDLAPIPDGVTPEYEMQNNQIPVVYAQAGETLDGIALKNDIDARQIYRYNDLPKGKSIEPGDIVYLKPKRKKGKEAYHQVKEGEDLHELSQLYGIKLKQLYKKNNIGENEEPAPGTTIYLQKKREDKPSTLTKSEFEKLEQERKNALLKNANPSGEKNESKDSVQTSPAAVEPEVIDPNAQFHIVKSGDNLYRISEKYHVFVEDILEWNNIASPDQIAKGDKIYLSKEAALKAGRIKTVTPKKEVASNEKVTPKTKTHIVSKGETAYKICRTYGINTDQLISWNGLKNVDSIREGQKLKVAE